MPNKDLIFDYVSADEIPAALQIEQEGYPADEAATESSFRYRQSQAGDLFLGAYQPNGSSRTLIGYVCATLSPDASLSHASMSIHVPDSSSVCIHSVCVAASHRRKGVALALLKEYIDRLEKARAEGTVPYKRVLLLAHDNLRELYEKAGFEWLGPSGVVHGARPWFEMRRNLAAPAEKENPERMLEENMQIPPGVLEALSRPRTSIPSSRLISDFHHALADLVEADEGHPGVSVNRFDLLCPKADCGSIILKKGAGKWVERASVQLEPTGAPLNPSLPPLPTPPETAQWWLVTPSPMAFENIGFTRPIKPLTESGKASPSWGVPELILSTGKKIKLLACAECDLGPVGWCEEGGSEFWLSCSRVAYRG
ncbi:hypothetical protein NLJ89_g5741 [Agrocybe chaxingu]|uniref:N-acetyltransferase domain-containing protein n=1 Tax=Agrocybe chaxingu TaxID=84603 RepID=A0A9W8K7U0_9AGAR|nr:hypothetical protein NLJ89_g5741 [Agrocybe chaxingu]